jgi:hypothetical protein
MKHLKVSILKISGWSANFARYRYQKSDWW